MKWELEVVSGFPVYSRTAGGSSALPSQGKPIFVSIPKVTEATSRQVPSWFFGDGTALFNAAAQQLDKPGVGLPFFPTITPLDPVLTSSVAQPSGATFGFRLSRQINRWVAAELSIERNGVFSLSDRAVSEIHATQNSYGPAFARVTAEPNATGGFTNGVAVAESAIKTRGGFIGLSSIALVIRLPGYRRLKPFLAMGGGGMLSGGNTPNATLVGTYDPAGPATSLSDPITDTVHLNFTPSRRWSYVSVLGGGFKIPIKSHFGIAVESRAYIYDNPISNSLSANHTTPQTLAFFVGNGPGPFLIIFPSPVPVGPPAELSSLSAPPISGFKSFTGKGLQSRVIFSIGPFWRF